ncbi:MAG: hypothetical protein J5994_03005 [Ruminococcus sp.]|nr:hypothetical protein [Ruminococcus sp.]
MRMIEKPIHALVYDGDRIYCRSVSYSRGGRIAETPALNERIYSRRVGAGPVRITVTGNFSPDEITFFSAFVNNFNSKSGRLAVDGWVLEKPVMLEGEVSLPADSCLGEFRFVFGGV